MAAVANPSRVMRFLAVRAGSLILPTAGAIALSLEVRVFYRGAQRPPVSVSCRPAVADLPGAAGAGDRRQAAAVVAAYPLGRLGLGHPPLRYG